MLFLSFSLWQFSPSISKHYLNNLHRQDFTHISFTFKLFEQNFDEKSNEFFSILHHSGRSISKFFIQKNIIFSQIKLIFPFQLTVLGVVLANQAPSPNLTQTGSTGTNGTVDGKFFFRKIYQKLRQIFVEKTILKIYS